MDSKASLTAAVIMLGSIKRSECIVSNDNDHVYLPIDLFSGCARIEEFVSTK